MIWFASTRENFVTDVRAMRRRVIEHIPAAQRDRQLKLGAGGLRDVEFAVQLLQLVHGRADETLRSPTTLTALRALIDGGYVGRRDGAAMEEAYEFLRTLEHRIQLYRLRRSHIVPDDPEDLRRIGRSMGFRHNPAENLTKEWQAHRRIVRRLHEKLFYQPLLEAVASLPTDGLRLTPLAAEQRLTALGFVDPKGALTHIQALTSGCRAGPRSRSRCCRRCWRGSPSRPTPTPACWRSARSPRVSGRPTGTSASSATRAPAPSSSPASSSSSRYVTDLILRAPDSVALLGRRRRAASASVDRLRSEIDLAARAPQRPAGRDPRRTPGPPTRAVPHRHRRRARPARHHSRSARR